MDKKQRNIAIVLTTLAVMIGISAVLSELFDTSRDLASIATWTPVRWTASPKTVQPVTPTIDLPTETVVIPSATPTIKRNNTCVYPLPYWVYYRDIWPLQITFKGFRFTQETALSVLVDPATDGVTGLLKQFIVANLNISRGVDSTVLGLTLGYTEDWLNLHPEGSEISSADLQVGTSLQSTLTQFNDGELGPILCSDALNVPTPVPPTVTPTATLTKIPTIYIYQKTPTPGEPGGPGVSPTSAPQPTQPPPPTEPPPTVPPPPTEPPPPTLAPTE